MPRPIIALVTLIAAMSAGTAQGQVQSTKPTAVHSAEMPELAIVGAFGIGTRMHDLAVGDRTISVRFWYPAVTNDSSTRALYKHRRALPGQQPLNIAETGIAVSDAKPIAGQTFPLVVMSHGYGGWAEHMSRLGETLASRGYVVASIDHRDQPFTDMGSFAASFGGVLTNRTRDQRAVLNAILGAKLAPQVAGQVNPNAIGLLGFSMGGYGSLTTAGAALDPAAPAFAQLSPAMRAQLPIPDPALASKIKAVVALAPWGGQPGAAVWQDAALASLRMPLLLVAGDQDDVVDYERGVKRLFHAAQGTDRYLLVYREAAHNIAGNPVTIAPDADFPTIEFLTDPVWRKERVEMINAHFIGAFLDLELKAEEKKRMYLEVPTPFANQGQWPSRFGQTWGGITAGDDQPGYWRGFQRRWARGLELHHKSAGK
jgi:predicted dienelactone hydrolase